jgi:hypothetical protein
MMPSSLPKIVCIQRDATLIIVVYQIMVEPIPPNPLLAQGRDMLDSVSLSVQRRTKVTSAKSK